MVSRPAVGTPFALTGVMNTATDTVDHQRLALTHYRATHPRSRRTRGYYLSRNGSSVREYSCSFCGRALDTECAKYRMTLHARTAIVLVVLAVALGCTAPVSRPRPVAPTPDVAYSCDALSGPAARRNRTVVVAPGVTLACY